MKDNIMDIQLFWTLFIGTFVILPIAIGAVASSLKDK
jgi:hypothetical protein